VIDHPYFIIAASGDRDWLEAYGDGGAVDKATLFDAEDFEAVIGGIASEEELTVGREREGPDLSALEESKGGCSVRVRRGQEARERSGRDEQIHGKTAQIA
jgi:hypothetical protein